MNRRFFIVFAVLLVMAGTVLIVLSRDRRQAKPPAPAPASTARTVPAPVPVAPVREAPREAVPAPEPRPRAAAPTPAAPVARAEPAKAAVLLHIDADVAGAQVFVDRRYLGETPLTASDVDPGTHTLNVSAKGYEGVAQTITVTPGTQDVMVKIREVRLDARLDVVHKHRIGSCTGTLIATPRGVRYETTNKDDAFTSSLFDLETFEVDYLQKNLRIKPAKGKRYDFTDPEGNADRLFVFHRDVDKARERLKKGDPAAQ